MLILDIAKLQEISRNRIVKTCLAVLCLAAYPFHVGFYDGCPIFSHLAYVFCHANVWHLLINLFALWSIRGRLTVLAPLFIAVCSSFLPMYVTEPTMGLSGFLFAWFGIAWGRVQRVRGGLLAVLPYIVITMLIGNVNGLLHLYTFLIGLVLSYTHHKYCYFCKR